MTGVMHRRKASRRSSSEVWLESLLDRLDNFTDVARLPARILLRPMLVVYILLLSRSASYCSMQKFSWSLSHVYVCTYADSSRCNLESIFSTIRITTCNVALPAGDRHTSAKSVRV